MKNETRLGLKYAAIGVACFVIAGFILQIAFRPSGAGAWVAAAIAPMILMVFWAAKEGYEAGKKDSGSPITSPVLAQKPNPSVRVISPNQYLNARNCQSESVTGRNTLKGGPKMSKKSCGFEPDPAVQWQRRTSNACQQYRSEVEVVGQIFRLRTEVALEEEKINLNHALHENAVTVWVASETYAKSPLDSASRDVYVQTAGTAHNAFAQAIGQHYNTCAQASSLHYQALSQARNVAFQSVQQSFTQAWQSFTQAMPQHKDDPEALDMTDWLMEPTPEECQQREEAEKAFTEALKQARTMYSEALAKATATWRQKAAQETTPRQEGTVDQVDASTALRKANRQWLTTALDAIEDLRAAFRTARQKYQLQIEG